MFVTRIESITKSRSMVYAEEQPLFALYNREISLYGIKEGMELSDDVYQEIVEQVLMKRAKLRAMHLLQKMDRTEQQLRRKLQEGGYPECVVNEAIAYVQKYHYQDDVRYAENYVDMRKGSRSRRQIQQELMQKGIAREEIQTALDDYDSDQEQETIREWMRKKGYCAESADLEERRRMYGFLLRKGFSMSDVLHCLRMESEQE